MRVGFVGLGKLGLPVAVCLGQKHSVLAYDINPELRKRRAYEHRELGPTKQDDFQEYFDNAEIHFAPDVRGVVQNADIVFVAVQTPHGPEYEGVTRLPATRADFSYKALISAVREVSQYSRPDQPIVVISTVLPGTMRRDIIPILKGYGQLVYNPFFIAMGQVMYDFLNPEFVLLGGQDGCMGAEKVAGFYKEFYTVVTPHWVGPKWKGYYQNQMKKDIPIRLMGIESAELTKVAYNCFSGDTSVSLLNGTEVAMGDLVDKGPQWFYGCDGEQIIPVRGEAVRAQEKRPLLEVELDNGQRVRCTYDHQWMMRDGSYRKAWDLRPGDSLMPLYRRLTKKGEDRTLGAGYELYLDLDGQWKATHRMFSDLPALSYRKGELVQCKRGKFHRVRHHLDGNRRNNYPDNLAWMEWKNHNRYHREMMSEMSKRNWSNPSMRERMIASVREAMRLFFADPERSKEARRIRSENQSRVWNQFWSDPENRERMKEVSARNMKELWERPEFRKDHSQRMSTLMKQQAADSNTKMGQYHQRRKEETKRKRDASPTQPYKWKEKPVCVLCGQKRPVARHLWAAHGITPTEYRELIVAPSNHKIVAVRLAGVEDTYCIVVEDSCHNFALSAGVFVHNTYLSMKVTVANSLMEICHKTPGCNIDDVTNTLKLATDRVVSSKYMDGGMGDGGGCHPRDNIAMSWLARKLNLSSDLFGSLMFAREKQAEWLADLIVSTQRKYNYTGYPVVLLGKAYKPETNLTVGSPAILFANILRERGVPFVHYDPYVDEVGDNSNSLPAKGFTEKALYFISTRHTSFASIRFPNGSVVIDPFRYIPPQEGVTIIPVGVGK